MLDAVGKVSILRYKLQCSCCAMRQHNELLPGISTKLKYWTLWLATDDMEARADYTQRQLTKLDL